MFTRKSNAASSGMSPRTSSHGSSPRCVAIVSVSRPDISAGVVTPCSAWVRLLDHDCACRGIRADRRGVPRRNVGVTSSIERRRANADPAVEDVLNR